MSVISEVKGNIVVPSFTSVENLNPGDLFETDHGDFGVRLWDSYAILKSPRGYEKAAARIYDPGAMASLRARKLPSGASITVKQK